MTEQQTKAAWNEQPFPLDLPENEQAAYIALTIFDTCHNLIRTLPALQHDKRNPSDTANTPHELTHAPDALRGYAATVYEPVKAMPQSAYDCEVGEFLRF